MVFQAEIKKKKEGFTVDVSIINLNSRLIEL